MTVHAASWSAWVTAGAIAGLVGAASMARAAEPGTNILSEARIEQQLGAQLPLELEFQDEANRTVRLGSFFGEKPVVLVMAYYKCPMLCTMVLNGLVKALNVVDLKMGEDYDVVTVSINPDETPELAAAKKASYVKEYRREGAAAGWHFLTGKPEAIRRLTQAVGFHYQFDPESGTYAHASGIMVATPAGVLSKYFYGIEYSGRDLRLGLVDASERRIGTPVDQVLLWCFHYDPVTGKYGVAIMRGLRAAALLTVLALATFMVRTLRGERRVAQAGVSS
ncbi:MAG: SCO family protein [Lentisphaerae bacterium]|nr:SCO family protein [Lentisphaerota bacterium]